ncbi:hypothetical protein ACFFOM_08895 [Microlunatus capsulatus]|uniref:Outer membrane protein assembly factor BamB n=1 Tax=Microlunatus capsulatus TaxID=99117 RepID=A0ABS4ZAR3_9ACTN|nr:hypothetical protein [Microlunatus capsulatus]MBP2418149.1 outer membrane protein assembly factor BamB [Microlunatus capsulatus]
MPEDPARPTAEVLDTGGPRWSSGPRRAVLVLLLALAVVAVAVVVDRTAPSSAPQPAPSSAPTAPGATTAATPGPPVVLRTAGPVPAGLGGGALFARTADTVFRVDLATGRVTATPAPVPGAAPVSFVAGAAGVLVRPADGSTGWLVPDDDAARPLDGLLGGAAQVLPASDGRIWVSELLDGRSSSFALTSFDGTPTGTSVRENGYFLADGSGGLLLVDAGGLWERVDDRWRRLAIGTALATGPHQHLLATCARFDDCGVVTLVRYDRARRTSRPVLGDTDLQLPGGGTVSADGRYVASTVNGDDAPDGQTRAVVLDLDTDRVVKQMVVRAPTPDVSGVAVWVPARDRLVGVDDGQLFVLDATTGTTTRPDLGLPPGAAVLQVALRTG